MRRINMHDLSFASAVIALMMSFLDFTSARTLKPPKITVAIRDHRVLEGGTVSFFCEASGVPTPTVMWKRNAMPIRPRASRNKMEIYKRTPHASALRIRKASAKKDNATFTCLATNIVGEASSSANLFVYPKRDDHPPGYPVIKATPGLLSLAINRPLLLDCDVKGDPKPRVTWLKNALPVDVSNDPRIQILETGSLQILNSQESDQGTYECVAENKWGVAYSHRAMIYVRSRRVAPNFIEVPSDQKVDAGSDVNLTCKAFGSPLPYVRWSQGANYITDDEKVPMDSAILTLTNIRQSTNYTCEASSNLDKIYHTVQVIVQEPASAPQNVQVSSNSANTVVITWDPPSRLNGKILGYKVFYTNKADEPIFFWESHVVNGDNRVATISGLKANVTYAISVLAFSAVGQGPMSHPIQVLTTQGAHIKTEKPEFTDIGGGNILLKLKKASVKNGVISHYHIIVVPEKKSGVKRMPTINKSWYFLFPKTYKYGGAEATKYKVLKMENGILGPSFAGLLSKL